MKKLLEFKEWSDLSEDEMFEMANISSKTTGIENVVIWVGANPSRHGRRIKVSNKPNSYNVNDCFVLTIPDYSVIGDINNKFITNKVLDKIKKFIELNMPIINDYSDGIIGTEEFLSLVKPV